MAVTPKKVHKPFFLIELSISIKRVIVMVIERICHDKVKFIVVSAFLLIGCFSNQV